jgi:hypothetical protein
MELYTKFYDISLLNIRYYYLLKLIRLGEKANQWTMDNGQWTVDS